MAELSNQSFQTIYIDSRAKNADEKIVLIEEMYETLPEATGVLNSLFKEKFYGMVAAGSTICLADFRAKLYDYDKEHKLGALEEVASILKKIVDVCYACGCEMVYYKGPSFYENIPEDLKNVSVAFDLKGLFGSGKQITKDIWENILWEKASFDIKKDFNKKNLKEQKELLKEMEKNKKSLLEALKESPKDKNNPLNEMLKSMDIDEDLQRYLGTDYANKYSYNIIDEAGVTIDSIERDIEKACADSIEDMKSDVTKQLDNLDKEESDVANNDKDRDIKIKSIIEKRRALRKEGQELELGANTLAIKTIRNFVKIGIDKNNNKRFVIISKNKIPDTILEKLKKLEWKIAKVDSIKELENINWKGDLKIEEKKKSLDVDIIKEPVQDVKEEPTKNEQLKKKLENNGEPNYQGPVPVKKKDIKLKL